MRTFNMLLISGLLLTSCNPDLTPASEDIVEPLAGKRKRIEAKIKAEETDYKRSRTDTDGDHSVSMAEEAAANQANELTEVNRVTLHDIELPDEVMLQILNELSVKDILQASQVCRYWHVLSEDPALWKALRLRINGDYPASDASKEQAKKHLVRIHVNTLSDPNNIAHLVNKYNLNDQHPFSKYKSLLFNLYNCEIYIPEEEGDISIKKIDMIDIIDEYVAQGNEEAIIWKINGIADGRCVYEHNPESTIAFIESLVEQGNEEAIKRKISGLIYGSHSCYGYKADHKAAVILIDSLVEQGSQQAIGRKIWALLEGNYGYKKDIKAAVLLNNNLVLQGNEEAIKRKMEGLIEGKYGYQADLKAAGDFIVSLALQGNEEAIKQKIWGLTDGDYGYEKNAEAAVALNESLVDKGNVRAIRRKIGGLAYDNWGYERDPEAAIAFLESLIEQGNEEAIRLKIEGLTHGNYGYEQNRKAAIAFIESLVKQDNEVAIRRKIKGLVKGNNLIYKRDDTQLKNWIEEQASEGKRWAYYLKAQGLKYGVLGFKKDRDAAIQYILKYGIPY